MKTLRLIAVAGMFFCIPFTSVARADLPNPSQPQQSDTPRTKPGACGSGVGLAFAGVAVAWGLVWAGHRVGRSRVAAVRSV